MSRKKRSGKGSESQNEDPILKSPEMKKLEEMTKDILKVSKEELDKRIKEDDESRHKS